MMKHLSVLREHLRDRLLGLPADPGIEQVVRACTAWLVRAQSRSATRDGGVAAYFSLKTGWSSSYPETTGYIIPTLLQMAELENDSHVRESAARMLTWLEQIQFEDGGFQGGMVDAAPARPVVFNTGQILFGLVAGVKQWGDTHRPAMQRAADWLVDVQDADGAWRRYRSPFTTEGAKTYETHVAWALMEADRIIPDRGYGAAAMRNIQWALSRQQDNGWFKDCGLGENSVPNTHTIGYVIRGIIEGWRFSNDAPVLGAARRTADALLSLVDERGWLGGTLDRDWQTDARWVCVTGSAQLAHCLFMLYEDTGHKEYLGAAKRLNRFVRRTVHVSGMGNTDGGVKGSYPTYGAYGPYRFLNWAAKFTIDSNLLEQRVSTGETGRSNHA